MAYTPPTPATDNATRYDAARDLTMNTGIQAAADVADSALALGGTLVPDGTAGNVSARRSVYLRRPVAPIVTSLAAPLSSETFSGAGITFNTANLTISNAVTLTDVSTPSAGTQMSFHGAKVTYDSNLSCWKNTINGSGTETSWSLGLEHIGSQIIFYFRCLSTTAQYWVFVDDKPVTAAPVAVSGLTAGSTFKKLEIPFATVAWRRIRVEFLYLQPQGFQVSKTDGYGPMAQRPWSILWFGDSWVEGANNVYLNTWCKKISRAVDAEAYIAGQGGTGYGTAGAFQTYITTNRLDSLSGVLPDLIWVSGSVNDRAVAPATIGTNAATLFSQLNTRFPGVPVIVQGVQSISSGAGFANQHDLVTAAVIASANAAPNVKLVINPRASTELWVTGSGNASVPTTDGSADRFMGSDYIHLTPDGNEHYARRALVKLTQLLRAA